MNPKKTLSPRGIFERAISEEDVILSIRQYLTLRGARVFRITERIPKRNWKGMIVGRVSERGNPDLYAWFPKLARTPEPLHFFIEVKRPGGKHSPSQEQWIKNANDDGVIAFFAESIDDVIREFGKRGISL